MENQVQIPNKKAFYKSKTFWINVCSILLSLIGLIMENNVFGVSNAVLLFASGVINIALRYITKEEIEPVTDTFKDLKDTGMEKIGNLFKT